MSTRQSTRSVLRGICCLGLWSLSGLTHPAAVPRRWTVLTAPAVLTQTSARAARAEPREPRSYEEVIAESGLEDWSVKDYEAMRDDVPRTSKFEKAIQRRLQKQPQATVLDIGTGPFALLAVLAAKAGAKKVYAIEKTPGRVGDRRSDPRNPEAAALAKETVERDGWKDSADVIEGDSMQVTLPEQVDLVVSELIGSIATQEGVEPIIRDARQRFLKESEGACGMIPARCQTCIVPVLYKGRSFLQRVTAPFEGVRSRGKPQAGSSTPLRIKSADEGNLEFLSEPQVLEDFDYCAAANSPKKLSLGTRTTGRRMRTAHG
eukprot:g31246.t1